MRAVALPRKPHGEVVVDLCPACRGLWFDAYESLQLTPEATLALFREVAALGEAPANTPAPSRCPRCRKSLAATSDLARSTRFAYWRCADGHGRFTPFVQFMREKDFVRPLTAAEIALVRDQIGSVRCQGCGAPVDLGRNASCSYCGAAVVALDPEALRRALAPAQPRANATVPRGVPDALVDALLASHRAEKRQGRGADLVLDVLGGLLTRL